jgi:hypothetical protein
MPHSKFSSLFPSPTLLGSSFDRLNKEPPATHQCRHNSDVDFPIPCLYANAQFMDGECE